MPSQSADPMRGGEENAALLPRRVIFGDPERSIVRISPDGTRIAFRAPLDGVLNLWVAPIDAIEQARPVTTVTDRNLGPWTVWMRDNRHVVFFREAAGDENWRAWRADLETGDVRPLTPGPGVTCYVQQSSRHFPQRIADSAQRPGQALLRHLPRECCDWGKRAAAAERGLPLPFHRSAVPGALRGTLHR